MSIDLDGFPRGGVLAGFLRSCRNHPSRPAVRVAGEELTYADLHDRAAVVAATIDDDRGSRRTAVLAHRTPTAYVGVLAALLRGDAYVPINPRHPTSRIVEILQRSGAGAVVVDEAGLSSFVEAAAHLDDAVEVIAPDIDNTGDVSPQLRSHRLLGRHDLETSGGPSDGAERGPDSETYVLFTSGSTGRPKGVRLADRNVVAYVEVMRDRMRLDESARCSQLFDLTFDVSVHDLFVAWEAGACVCVPSTKALLKPSGFVTREELTTWFSVPSTAIMMQRFGGLKPGAYPSLRWVHFVGEALPVETANAFAAAAPNATLENLYGPTETTIACTGFAWDPATSPARSRMGIAPIGAPFPGTDVAVVDEQLRGVGPEEPGELLVGGDQVAIGYLDDPDRTAAAFVSPPDRPGRHYLTGDRVVMDHDGVLHFLGRTDSQVQVHGHRVEVGEVEAALRGEDDVAEAVVIPWPSTGPGAAEALVAFVTSDETIETGALRRQLARTLPEYMIPRSVHLLDSLPRNVNGKYDRDALRSRLEEGS